MELLNVCLNNISHVPLRKRHIKHAPELPGQKGEPLKQFFEYIKNGKSDSDYILMYIPTGKENAVSREYLSTVTGMSDRRVRNAIHEARRKALIVNLSEGKGYYIADTEKENERLELLRYFRQEESRLKSIGWALKPVRKELKKWGLIA